MIGQTTNLTYLTDPSFADVDGPCDSDAPRNVCAPRNALPETTLYVPLQFWYCRNPGLALPLIALQYHEVRINLDIRPIDECLWAVSALDCGNLPPTAGAWSGSQYTGSATQNMDAAPTGTRVNTAYNQSLVAASLYVDYVFLDTDERRRMAQNPHEYLIEQLQFTGDESVGSSSNKIKFNFNHPCKELIWIVQPDGNVDYCASLECGNLLWNAMGAQPFNYTDTVDALPPALHAFAGPDSIGGGAESYLDASGLFYDPGAADIDPETLQYWGQNTGSSTGFGASGALGTPNATPQYSNGISQGGANPAANRQRSSSNYSGPNLQDYHDSSHGVLSAVSDAGAFVLSETALNMHCWGENPVVTAKLQLNGQDRFSEREGTYFDLVQPYQHHTRSPDTGINVYSFALRPEEHQPSGTCN
ncbi:MAG TPA: hypothetical protein EYN66_03910, partial [Myxococcales bacterium]|nr:hypothetical protein [Myxococcales bacterium]